MSIKGAAVCAPVAVSRSINHSVAPVVVKHGKQQYDVELDTNESADAFKAQIFALTGVEVDKQKCTLLCTVCSKLLAMARASADATLSLEVYSCDGFGTFVAVAVFVGTKLRPRRPLTCLFAVMGKGVVVKSDTQWSKVKGLKDGYTFMMIGQAGPLPEAPTEKTVFVEDLPPDQRMAAQANLPPGTPRGHCAWAKERREGGGWESGRQSEAWSDPSRLLRRLDEPGQHLLHELDSANVG